ncbi:MAG: hypothetical protein CVT73_15900 [Alphaproteobacteria bacterium HGW-Alphaproteobacteria-12]|nr:MAG: hypothetical protein CVT73_15900 [Alphaproteobacteria bacterium HGW-Alphaproteobacteria-12]
MARLVPLCASYSLAEVACLRAMLAAYGIRSMVSGYWHVRNDWFLVFAFGGVHLHVFDHDAEAARALIVPVEDYVDDLESEPRAILRAPFRFLVSLFLLYAFGAPIPLWITKRRFLSEESD